MSLNKFSHIPDKDRRYFVVYDRIEDDDKVYGIIRLDTSAVIDGIQIQFFNEIGNITLTARETSRSEWETMREFDLFPVLHPFNQQKIVEYRVKGTVGYPQQLRDDKIITQYMVNFRDY